ncbi:MAG: ABC transporter substrate binding protein [Candidatus Hydrothermales bacterium]
MRKIEIIFIFSLCSKVLAETLIIDGLGNEEVLKKIKEVIKDNVILSKPENFTNKIEIYNLVILLGDKALELYTKNKWEKPCIVGYVKKPVYEIPITGTGLRYELPPSVLFTIISTLMKWVKKVGVILPYEFSQSNYVEELRRAARNFNIDLKIVFVQGRAVKKALSELNNIDLFLLVPSDLTIDENSSRYFIEELLKINIPVFGFEKSHALMGALMSYSIEKVYLKELLDIITLVSEGRDPSTIPVRYPSTYEIFIKKKTRDILKLNIDKSTFKNINEI